ncbi:armadillo-type protein [Gorgonomyces haynaldii]|nr:armadillo-type protein [Gorgonomyces haynaldii]
MKQDQLNQSQLERFLLVMDKYQEMPQLLDKHLEHMVKLLTDQWIQHLNDSFAQSTKQTFAVFYNLCKLRGYKIIVDLLPNEVRLLEPVSLLLEQTLDWNQRFGLMLWLSLLIRTPFDLVRISDTIGNRVYSHCMKMIEDYGPEYLPASLCLARYLCRTDTLEPKKQFLSQVNIHTTTFKLRGLLTVLCFMAKYHKLQMDPAPLIALFETKTIQVNALLRKLLCKLLQRLGLQDLKPAKQPWKMTRTKVKLQDNLQGLKSQSQTIEQEEIIDIPESVEIILEHLFNLLNDRDTVVRYSSAKGIARIASRLDYEAVDQIVGNLVSFFEQNTWQNEDGYDLSGTSDALWHGTCLSLAELGRRGLLLPHRLQEAIPWIVLALSYEQRRGSHSVGAHVRDASCYILWSFARSYESSVLEKFSLQMAQELVATSLLDRETGVRRAASAAFQENVGRHGLFPEGIQVLTIADFVNVGNRQLCFTDLVVSIAQFEPYRHVLVRRLVRTCGHWDRHMRTASAYGLGLLCSHYPSLEYTKIIDQLLALETSDVLLIHGQLCGLAGLLEFQPVSDEYYSKTLKKIQSFPKQLFEHFGSDLVLEGVAKITHALANIQKAPQELLEFLELGINRPEQELVSCCTDACAALMTDVSQEQLEKWMDKLQPRQEVFTRCGYIQLLGKLSKPILLQHLDTIVAGLVESCQVLVRHLDHAECRRDAIQSFTKIVRVLKGEIKSYPETLRSVSDCILNGMNDYTTDSRGDVGSWVREHALLGIECLVEVDLLLDPQQAADKIILSCLEKIDKLRFVASNVLKTLLQSSIEIQDKQMLQDMFKQESDINWYNPKDVYPFMAPLIQSAYQETVLIGFSISIGGLTETLVRHGSEALVNALLQMDLDILLVFRQLLEKHKKNDRILLPLMETVDLVLSSGLILPEHEQKVDLLLETVIDCVGRTKSVKKISIALKLYSNIALLSPEQLTASGKKALARLISYLVHPYPKTRSQASEILYLVGTTVQGLEEAEDLILGTGWDEIQSAKDAKQQLLNRWQLQ